MLSVSQLAKQFDLSRTTLLYYEKIGLLIPQTRTANGYRCYGKKQIDRLHQILTYKSYGVPLSQIPQLLEMDEQQHTELLKQQFQRLDDDIQQLRQQQRSILQLLNMPGLLKNESLNKDQWVQIMKAAGFSESDMKQWHIQFESMQPQAHQAFLKSLNIDEKDIQTIRQWSRGE